MGYACPVCHAPQADGEHLANHLAFSALLGHDDHAEWLDEHAPGWDEDDPADLAERVTPHAESVEYPEVFEDTTEAGKPDVSEELLESGDHDHAHAGTREPGRMSPEAQRAVREARELTERRREAAAEGDDRGADESDDRQADQGRNADEAEDPAGSTGDDADENGK